jgi:F-type H+-transporting ATPase subunit b
MSFSWSTFALQVVNFLVLVWLLKRFLFKPVSTIVARRKAEIERAQAEAEKARQSAEQARKEFERRRTEIDAQRQAISEQTRAELSNQRSKMIQSAQGEIDKLKSAMLKQLDEEREDAAREISDRALQIAVQLADHLLRQCAAPLLDELFLDRLLNHLDRLTMAERAALLDQSGPDRGLLSVTTASPLEPETESKWRRALTAHLGGSPQIKFAVDKDLIAGTELKFPLAVLRFTWRQALAEAQQELSRRDNGR